MVKKLQLTSHPPWILTLEKFVHPYWEGIMKCRFVREITTGKLDIGQARGCLVQLYPFIHTFPKFLAESLTKVEDDYSRSFLIDNIRVEKEHADHWVWMGLGFGVPRKSMFDLVEGKRFILRDVQHLTDWLWHINTRGTLAEAVAATSYAIEGVTGEISRCVVNGFAHYEKDKGVRMDPKTYKWMREHSIYDDEHPKVALEVVKKYAKSEDLQTKVMYAARRSLQLLFQALDAIYCAYIPALPPFNRNGQEKRTSERRTQNIAMAHPDRRFRQNRGSPFQITA